MITSSRCLWKFRPAGFIVVSIALIAAARAQGWQPLTSGLPANARVQAIASDGTDLFIGVGMPLDGVGIYRSTDHGASWTKTSDGPGPNTAIYAEELLVNGNTVLATRYVNTGELFCSSNSGTTWQLASGLPDNSALPGGGGVVDLVRDGSTYYAQVFPQGPYKSTDGGLTWSPANAGIGGTGYHIRVIGGRVFATQNGSPGSGLWTSDDQGGTWTARGTSPAMNFNSPVRLATQGSRIFLAATQSNTTPSVLSSIAGVAPWQGSDTGLPGGNRHTSLATTAAAVFSAGGTTVNGGTTILPYVAQSSDAGLSWSTLTATGMLGTESTSQYVSDVCTHGGSLYAATYSFGGTHRFLRLVLTGGEFPQAPVIASQPAPAAVTSGVGESVSFQALATGKGPLSYQWRLNGNPLTGKTAPTLTVSPLAAGDAGSYTVAVTNATGTTVSDPAVLAVTPSDPGKLDYGFDSPMGKVFSGSFIFGGTAHAVWPQADGTLLVAGDFDRVAATPGSPFLSGGTACGNLARFTAAGALDPAFTLGTGATGGTIKALAVQPDGKILIGGNFTGYQGTPRARFARLHADGTLDTSFMAAGTGFDGEVLEILVQPDGKILVGGSFANLHGQNRVNLARLLDTGARDPDFLNGLAGPNGTVRALALSGDRIYLGGSFGKINGTDVGRIGKIDLSGVRDTAFNPAGSGFNGDVYDLAVAPDGSAVTVTGSFMTYNLTTAQRLARLTATGGLDNVFGTGLGAVGYALALQPDGKVLVGGNFTTADGTTRNRLARFLPGGTLDSSFNPGAGLISAVEDMALQGDGKLLLASASTQYDSVARTLVARVFTGSPPLVAPDPIAVYLAAAAVPAGHRGPEDDPDLDGIPNLLEYALVLDPMGSSGGIYTGSLPVSTLSATHFLFTYSRLRADLVYTVEASDDLADSLGWSASGVDQGTPGPGGVTTASIPISAARRFLRLKVEDAP